MMKVTTNCRLSISYRQLIHDIQWIFCPPHEEDKLRFKAPNHSNLEQWRANYENVVKIWRTKLDPIFEYWNVPPIRVCICSSLSQNIINYSLNCPTVFARKIVKVNSNVKVNVLLFIINFVTSAKLARNSCGSRSGCSGCSGRSSWSSWYWYYTYYTPEATVGSIAIGP